MKRQIILDTETTGLKPENGDKIVEIGAVEIIDNKKTGRTFQTYLNPGKEMDEHVIKVHGITNDFLRDKPKFKDIFEDFIKFLDGAETVMHNADFDIKFLNKEISDINKGNIWNYTKNTICTLKLDKRLYAGERKHDLNTICTRLNIDISNRIKHGALLDSELLADYFIKVNEIHSINEIEADLEQKNWTRSPIKRFNVKLKSINITPEEEKLHDIYLKTEFEDKTIIPVFKKKVINKKSPQMI